MAAKKGAGSPSPQSDASSCRVVGYVRVSTNDQLERGISLDAQRHRVAAYCAAHGLVLADVAEDAGISARKTTNRPGLQRALTALKRGDVAGLVTVKLDRLSRTTADVLGLVAAAEREHWALHSIDERLDTGSPHGRFTVTILAALSQLEREQVAERTRAAMAELRRQGRRTSRFAPFGFRIEGRHVVPVEEEQRLLEQILALRGSGRGPRRIAAALNADGAANPRSGKPWSEGSLKAILRTQERHKCATR